MHRVIKANRIPVVLLMALSTTFFVKQNASASLISANVAPSSRLAVGTAHTCAIKANNKALCWGLNTSGQIGDGSSVPRRTRPVTINTGTLTNKPVVSITAGFAHTCALTGQGRVSCWGDNTYGQLGLPSDIASRNVPTDAMRGALRNREVIAIDAGENHTCAVISTGAVICWGANEYGQLGDGGTATSFIPQRITTGALANGSVAQISAGEDHTCAVTSIGSLACWGANAFGQLGDGSFVDRSRPTLIGSGALAGQKISLVSAGGFHTCATLKSGAVVCWGANEDGQLGNSTFENNSRPTRIVNGALANKRLIAVNAGRYHTCALTLSYALVCWGSNNFVQLGDAEIDDPTIPTVIRTGALQGKQVIDVRGGEWHTCARDSEGGLACWGANFDGNNGDGTTNDHEVPMAVPAFA